MTWASPTRAASLFISYLQTKEQLASRIGPSGLGVLGIGGLP